jgi:hypothetical protein
MISEGDDGLCQGGPVSVLAQVEPTLNLDVKILPRTAQELCKLLVVKHLIAKAGGIITTISYIRAVILSTFRNTARPWGKV